MKINEYYSAICKLFVLCCLFVSQFFYLSNNKVYATFQDTDQEVIKNIINTLNKETENIYTDYSSFTENISNLDSETAIREFSLRLPIWESIFLESKDMYSLYINYSNQDIVAVSKDALKGSEMGLESIFLYKKALDSENTNEFDNYLGLGDDKMQEAVTYHDKAVNYYNNISGINTAVSSRNYLYLVTFLAFIFSVILFIKSKSPQVYSADILRVNVYKDLFASSVWFLFGIVVTAITYGIALENGGTYYILYGPMFVGILQLMRGLYTYFTKGRKLLNGLKEEQKTELIENAFSSNQLSAISLKKIALKNCTFCKKRIDNSTIVCPHCGKNTL